MRLGLAEPDPPLQETNDFVLGESARPKLFQQIVEVKQLALCNDVVILLSILVDLRFGVELPADDVQHLGVVRSDVELRGAL